MVFRYHIIALGLLVSFATHAMEQKEKNSLKQSQAFEEIDTKEMEKSVETPEDLDSKKGFLKDSKHKLAEKFESLETKFSNYMESKKNKKPKATKEDVDNLQSTIDNLAVTIKPKQNTFLAHVSSPDYKTNDSICKAIFEALQPLNKEGISAEDVKLWYDKHVARKDVSITNGTDTKTPPVVLTKTQKALRCYDFVASFGFPVTLLIILARFHR